jgi:hypothetical protein
MKIYPPFYAVRTKANCWKCGTPQDVVGLIATSIEEDDDDEPTDSPATIQGIITMPEPLLLELVNLRPAFALCHSQSLGVSYYANACSCGTFFGDHYLYSEPGGGFFPMSDEEFAGIEVHDLPLTDALELDATWGMGIAGDLVEKGQRA